MGWPARASISHTRMMTAAQTMIEALMRPTRWSVIILPPPGSPEHGSSTSKHSTIWEKRWSASLTGARLNDCTGVFLGVSDSEGQIIFFKWIFVSFRVGQKAMPLEIEQGRRGIVFSEEGD